MNIKQLIKRIRNNLLPLAASEKEIERLDKIIAAISIVDRIFFVKDKSDAYTDTALSIGYNQTISQPSTVARMLMLADLKTGNHVLEIGSGSGWNACLVGYLIYPGEIISMDIIPELLEIASNNLDTLRKNLNSKDYKRLINIKFEFHNILKELDAWQHKYDRIIATAGINSNQEKVIHKLANELLNEKGILVCPQIHGPLIILKKEKGIITKEITEEQYIFVPLLE